MTSETPDFRTLAESLIETCADLQRQVLLKHTTAIIEELHAQITKRNADLAAANARAEKLEKAILKIRQALLPDPHDEREISIDWVRGAIGRIADAAIAAQEKPNG